MNFLEPNVKKFRKHRKGMNKGLENSSLDIGNYGLIAVSRGFLRARQFEAARKAFVQSVGKRTKIIPKFHLNKSRSKKPSENRMGKGKGDIDHWVFSVRPGRIILEVKDYKNRDAIIEALKTAMYKLPFKAKIVDMS